MKKMNTLYTLSILAVFAGGILVVVGGFGSTFFGGRKSDMKDSLHKEELGKLRLQLVEIQSQDSVTQKELTALKEINIELNESMKPIVQLLEQYYPDLSYDQALKKIEKQLASLNDKTEVLDKRTAPRIITKEQGNTIISALIILKSKGYDRVNINYHESPECQNYAMQIRNLFKLAGWGCNFFSFTDVLILRSGLEIGIPKNGDPSDGVSLLMEIFKRAGITFKKEKWVDATNNNLHLIIWPKG